MTHWSKVEGLATALMKHQTLNGDEVHEIVDGNADDDVASPLSMKRI